MVRGNADRELVALARGEEPTVGESYEIDQWATSQPTAAHVDRLANLPHPLDVSGFGPVVFCHGTPRNPSEPLGTPRYDDEVVLVDTRLQRWAEVVSLPWIRARHEVQSAPPYTHGRLLRSHLTRDPR